MHFCQAESSEGEEAIEIVVEADLFDEAVNVI